MPIIRISYFQVGMTIHDVGLAHMTLGFPGSPLLENLAAAQMSLRVGTPPAKFAGRM